MATMKTDLSIGRSLGPFVATWMAWNKTWDTWKSYPDAHFAYAIEQMPPPPPDAEITDRIEAIAIYAENEGVLKLVHNSVFHERTKHIKVHVHFIREHVLKHNIQLQFFPTDEQ